MSFIYTDRGSPESTAHPFQLAEKRRTRCLLKDAGTRLQQSYNDWGTILDCMVSTYNIYIDLRCRLHGIVTIKFSLYLQTVYRSIRWKRLERSAAACEGRYTHRRRFKVIIFNMILTLITPIYFCSKIVVSLISLNIFYCQI